MTFGCVMNLKTAEAWVTIPGAPPPGGRGAPLRTVGVIVTVALAILVTLLAAEAQPRLTPSRVEGLHGWSSGAFSRASGYAQT